MLCNLSLLADVANPLVEIVTAPDQALTISEEFVAQFLLAADGNGVENAQFLPIATLQESPIFLQLEQSNSSVFVYDLQFYAASILNNATIDVSVVAEGGIV